MVRGLNLRGPKISRVLRVRLYSNLSAFTVEIIHAKKFCFNKWYQLITFRFYSVSIHIVYCETKTTKKSINNLIFKKVKNEWINELNEVSTFDSKNTKNTKNTWTKSCHLSEKNNSFVYKLTEITAKHYVLVNPNLHWNHDPMHRRSAKN